MRYMKSFRIGIVGLVLALPLNGQGEAEEAPPLPAAGSPLVFVNTAVILPVAPGAEAAQTTFQAELADYQAELQGLASRIDSMLADYRRQESMMDAAAKEAKQQEILQLQQSAQTRQYELETESEQRRATLLEPILDNVRDVIEAIRTEQSYSVVIDINEPGVVAYDPALDITSAVLERLGVSPPPAAGPGS
jgi:outer membrane protein